MKKSILFLVFCSLSIFLIAQDYHQNGSFESHTPVQIGHPLFMDGDVDHWIGSAGNAELHSNIWCPFNGGPSQTITASDGDFFGRIFGNSYIRNNLDGRIFPGQTVTGSLDHLTSSCSEPFVEGALYLHNSEHSDFSFFGNFLMGEFVSGPISWINTSIDVTLPAYDNLPCFFDQGDIRIFGAYNNFEGGDGNDSKTDPVLMHVDNYRLTGCTTPTEDLLFYNFSDEVCTRVNFTLDCNLDEKVWYFWEFGDGTTLCGSDAPNPTHDYPSPGSYDVELTTVNTSGCIEKVQTTIHILCPGCDETVADFTFECRNCRPSYALSIDPVTGKVISTLIGYNCRVRFTDNSTSGSPIVSWAWSHPNGSSTLQNPSFSFSAPVIGTNFYEVCLTVIDEDGCVDTVCEEISVPCRFRASDGEQLDDRPSIQNLSTHNITTYPNPAGDQLTLEINGEKFIENLEATIYNLNGQLMKRISNDIDDSYAKLNIETNDFPNGTYIMKIQYENEVVNRKIIIQR